MPESIRIDELRSEWERLQQEQDGSLTAPEIARIMGLDYACKAHAIKARKIIEHSISQGKLECVGWVRRRDYSGVGITTKLGFRLTGESSDAQTEG